MDQVVQVVSHGNSDLFIDAAKKLVDNSLVTTIPVKELNYEQITVSMSMVVFYVTMYCVAAPLAFIIAGIVTTTMNAIITGTSTLFILND